MPRQSLRVSLVSILVPSTESSVTCLSCSRQSGLVKPGQRRRRGRLAVFQVVWNVCRSARDLRFFGDYATKPGLVSFTWTVTTRGLAFSISCAANASQFPGEATPSRWRPNPCPRFAHGCHWNTSFPHPWPHPVLSRTNRRLSDILQSAVPDHSSDKDRRFMSNKQSVEKRAQRLILTVPFPGVSPSRLAPTCHVADIKALPVSSSHPWS